MTAPTRARFPEVGLAAGHYESFFAKLSDPGQPLGVWIRYTVHKRPGAAAHGSLWFTLFDGDGKGPLAGKVTLGPEETGSGDDHYIHVGASRFGPGGLTGSLSAAGHEFAWDLRIVSSDEPYHHLPRPWMYRAPIPRTKLLSPHPGAVFTGTLVADGRHIEVGGWPGTVGHNWGAQHAERWMWLHGTGFEDRSVWFDAALGRIKLGPLTTPWIGNARLVLDGIPYRLGGPDRVPSTEVSERESGCSFVLTGKGVEVRGAAGAEPRDFVGWIYADPDGGQHHAVNCSIASMTLVVERPGGAPVELRTAHGAAYELGMREAPREIAIQPFADG